MNLKIFKKIVLNNKQYKILAPEGYVDFLGVNKIVKNDYLHLKFSNNSELKCSQEHPILTINGIIKAKELDKKTEIKTINGGCFLLSKKKIKKKIELYDIIDSGEKNLYYSNNIISHNCQFIGSTNTLIHPNKLRTLVFKNPIAKDEFLDIHEQPLPNHVYVITVDVSEGQNLDYSTFSIFDVTEIPYKHVGKYRNKNISPLLFPTPILEAARKYNDAFVLVEINTIGLQVADILHYELAYENLIKIEMKGKQGQQFTPGFKKKIAFGLKTSVQTKKIGCANLKTLIENDKLIIHDADTILELTTFSAHKTSFAGEEGNNDDLVMTLVHFGWLSSQKYFKENINNDIRKALVQEYSNILDTETVPFGFIDDGVHDDFDEKLLRDKDGALWKTERSEKYIWDDLNWDWRHKL